MRPRLSYADVRWDYANGSRVSIRIPQCYRYDIVAPQTILVTVPASAVESADIVRRYDDRPDGKLELAEFAELVRDLERGTLRQAAAGGGPAGGGVGVRSPPSRPAFASASRDLL